MIGFVSGHGFSRAEPRRTVGDGMTVESIAANPVKAGLVDTPEEFPYCFTYLAKSKAAGAKALDG
jgi:putative transposase